MRDVIGSLEVENEAPILGDSSSPSTEEIRQIAYGLYTSQNRAVTKQDYTSLIYSMPPKYGAVKRCAVVRDTDSFKRNINIYVLSESVYGNLATSPITLKENIKVWLSEHRMVNDTVDILDAKIINIGISFEILADLETNKFILLTQATSALRTRMSRIKMDIGEPFRVTNVYNILKKH